MVAEVAEAPAMGLAVAPGTEGACGTADRVVLPVCEVQKKVQGESALGKVSGLVVLVKAESRGFAAGLGEKPGQSGCNTALGPESHSLLVPVAHMIPSNRTKAGKTSNTTG